MGPGPPGGSRPPGHDQTSSYGSLSLPKFPVTPAGSRGLNLAWANGRTSRPEAVDRRLAVLPSHAGWLPW